MKVNYHFNTSSYIFNSKYGKLKQNGNVAIIYICNNMFWCKYMDGFGSKRLYILSHCCTILPCHCMVRNKLVQIY